MRTFNYAQEMQNLLTPEIVQLLTCIHDCGPALFITPYRETKSLWVGFRLPASVLSAHLVLWFISGMKYFRN